MPKIKYANKRFTADTLLLIQQANTILQEYRAQGFVLTLRQLYYQFVARDLLPNKQQSYDRLGDTISRARIAGLVDWHDLIDRTRNLQTLQHFNGPKDALTKLAGWYHIDMWEHQEYRPEVWIEKDALVGVIEHVCQTHDIPYFSCRGYTSQSEMWRAAQRLRGHLKNNQAPYIIHFGDHDPSGMDMSRDIKDRLTLFMANYEFERVALNMDQIEEYQPPPNPAKVTDSRAKAYIEEFGDDSWELDALEPAKFAQLITDRLDSLANSTQWNKDLARKEKVKKRLNELAENWKE